MSELSEGVFRCVPLARWEQAVEILAQNNDKRKKNLAAKRHKKDHKRELMRVRVASEI